MIRSLEEQVDRPIGILVDLQGPKLRVGTVRQRRRGRCARARPVRARLDPAPGGADACVLPHPEILDSLQPGHRVLIDDGKVLLARASAVRPAAPIASVEVAGKISNKKGVSLPDTTLPTSAMTDKDRADLDAALEEDIDWIALSFVQRPEDVVEVQAHRRAARLGDGEDREAAGDRAAR